MRRLKLGTVSVGTRMDWEDLIHLLAMCSCQAYVKRSSVQKSISELMSKACNSPSPHPHPPKLNNPTLMSFTHVCIQLCLSVLQITPISICTVTSGIKGILTAAVEWNCGSHTTVRTHGINRGISVHTQCLLQHRNWILTHKFASHYNTHTRARV
jgi:hypothetical protein